MAIEHVQHGVAGIGVRGQRIGDIYINPGLDCLPLRRGNVTGKTSIMQANLPSLFTNHTENVDYLIYHISAQRNK